MSPTGYSVGSKRVFALQKYNADYDLSATQSADTLAFVSLLEEKLLPVLVRLGGAAGKGSRQGWALLPGAVPSWHQSLRALSAATSQECGVAGMGI